MGKLTSTTAKYMTGADRKAQILDAACALFAKKSYDTVSVREIAKECNCSPPLVLKLFKSKEAIYSALVEEWEAMCNEPWIKSIPDGDAMTALESLFNLLASGKDERNPSYRPNLASAIVSRVRHQSRHIQIMQKQQNVGAEIILPLILRGQQEGVFKPGNAEETAELIWCIIYGTRMISESYPAVNKVKFSLLKELIL